MGVDDEDPAGLGGDSHEISVDLSPDLLLPERDAPEREYRSRRPETPRRSRGRRRHRGVGAVVIGAVVIVVAGSLVGLWYMGQSRVVTSDHAAFTAAQLSSLSLTASQLPSDWELGAGETSMSPADLMTGDYWSAETVSDASCEAVDMAFGLLVPGQGSDYAGWTSDVIASGTTAYSPDGQFVQQTSRTFVDSSSAAAMMDGVDSSLGSCSSYEAQGADGQTSQEVVRAGASGLVNDPIAYTVSTSGQVLHIVLLQRGNVVTQVLVSDPADTDTSAVQWSDVAAVVDGLLSGLPSAG